MLVGQRQTEPEAARLGQEVGDAGRQVQVVLNLVDVGHDRAATGGGLTGAGHGDLPEPGDHEGAKQGGSFLAEQPFGQRHDQNPAAAQHFGQVQGRIGLAEHVAQPAAQQKGAQLVEHRPDGGRAFPLAQALVPGPERTEGDGVIDAPDQLPPKRRVGQQQRHLAQRHAGLGDQGQ